jgi:hypothetical protein
MHGTLPTFSGVTEARRRLGASSRAETIGCAVEDFESRIRLVRYTAPGRREVFEGGEMSDEQRKDEDTEVEAHTQNADEPAEDDEVEAHMPRKALPRKGLPRKA